MGRLLSSAPEGQERTQREEGDRQGGGRYKDEERREDYGGEVFPHLCRPQEPLLPIPQCLGVSPRISV